MTAHDFRFPSAGTTAALLRSAVALLAVVACCETAVAKEFDLRAVDLRVVGDTKWTGGGWGGYHPIRYEITNFGPVREIELRFMPHERGRHIPTVRRRVRLEQNATANITLAVPLVGGRNAGRLDVLLDGEIVPALSVDVSLTSPIDGEFPQASMLVISPHDVQTDGFETAVTTVALALTDPSFPRGHVLSGNLGLGDTRVAVVEPSSLPASWLDYSGLDLVAVELETLAVLRTDERTALFDWVATGGRLIISRAGAANDAAKRFDDMTGEPVAAAEAWRSARAGERRPLAVRRHHGPPGVPNEGDPMSMLGQLRDIEDALPLGVDIDESVDRLEGMLGELGGPSGAAPVEPSWPAEPSPFVVRRSGFGRVALVADDVFLANGADWTWLLSELGGASIIWPIRHGMISGDGDMEFLNQPIPGVRGVPTAAFLTLMTLFALVIGPVNYLLLWRRSQLSRLIVTVPVIAVGTSVLLFGYAVASHGFSTKGRIRSVTLFDPATKSATSVSRMTLFAGLAPASGLRFSNDTAVYPLYPFREAFVDGDVDWTETQALTGGWFRTRTRTQFLSVGRRDERGRLTVASSNGTLRVTNGFTVPLSKLVLTGDDGRVWFAATVPAGAEAEMHPIRDADWTGIRELAIDRIPEPPNGVEPDDLTSSFLGEMHWRWYQRGWRPSFAENLLERHMARLLGQVPGKNDADEVAGDDSQEGKVGNDDATDRDNVDGDTGRSDDGKPDDRLHSWHDRLAFVSHDVSEDTIDVLAEPRGFLAVTETNPGIDVGGVDVDERGSLHLLLGRW